MDAVCFTDKASAFKLGNNEWIAMGKGTCTMKLWVDSKESVGITDVAIAMTYYDGKTYQFLCCPYSKPRVNKGNKFRTWILPKVMDMNNSFKEQTLAFRFADVDQAEAFQTEFARSFRPKPTLHRKRSDSRGYDTAAPVEEDEVSVSVIPSTLDGLTTEVSLDSTGSNNNWGCWHLLGGFLVFIAAILGINKYLNILHRPGGLPYWRQDIR